MISLPMVLSVLVPLVSTDRGVGVGGTIKEEFDTPACKWVEADIPDDYRLSQSVDSLKDTGVIEAIGESIKVPSHSVYMVPTILSSQNLQTQRRDPGAALSSYLQPGLVLSNFPDLYIRNSTILYHASVACLIYLGRRNQAGRHLALETSTSSTSPPNELNHPFPNVKK